MGTIAVGQEADLVLLEADPLEDMANVGRIHTVFLNGKAFGPETRQKMLERFDRLHRGAAAGHLEVVGRGDSGLGCVETGIRRRLVLSRHGGLPRRKRALVLVVRF